MAISIKQTGTNKATVIGDNASINIEQSPSGVWYLYDASTGACISSCAGSIGNAMHQATDHLEEGYSAGDADFEYDHWFDDDRMTDVEADADTLRGAGMGTDEDYGYFGGDDY